MCNMKGNQMLNAAQQLITLFFGDGVTSTDRYKAPHANRGTPMKKHHSRKASKDRQETLYREGLQKPQAEKYRLRKSQRSKSDNNLAS